MAVVALTLVLVAPVVVIRLDDFFRNVEEERLNSRANASTAILQRLIAAEVGDKAVVRDVDGTLKLNPQVETLLVRDGGLQLVADKVAEADVTVVFGTASQDTTGVLVPNPDAGLTFKAATGVMPDPGQARDPAIPAAGAEIGRANPVQDWGMVVTLSNPYTSRASTLAAITGLLLVMAALALVVAVLVAAFLAYRFTVPITRLTEASRRLAAGDLTSRVATDELSSGTLELRALSTQFNVMADHLEESVDIIRRDRDQSRDFLADVSHELRTPIAATRTFIELLQGPAGRDPAARAEFLESSAVQLDRLDWLAQNLLELSKLDSGLVLLELRPDDVRGTIESAVEQQQRRRGAEGDPADGHAARTGPCASGTTPRGSGRSSRTSWATPSSSRPAAARSGSSPVPRPTGERESRSWTRASGSRRTSSRTSSIASTAGPSRARPGAPGRASAWRS